MLHCLLLGNDYVQDFHRSLPSARHCPKYPQVDHLHRHGPHHAYWTGFLLRHITTMHPNRLLLGQTNQGRLLRQCGHHHWPDILVQRHLSYQRLYLCDLTFLPHLVIEHVYQDEGHVDSGSRNGLRVSRTHFPLFGSIAADPQPPVQV